MRLRRLLCGKPVAYRPGRNMTAREAEPHAQSMRPSCRKAIGFPHRMAAKPHKLHLFSAKLQKKNPRTTRISCISWILFINQPYFVAAGLAAGLAPVLAAGLAAGFAPAPAAGLAPGLAPGLAAGIGTTGVPW